MIHTTTGLVGNDLYVLGTSGVPSYLFDCERPALFDAGLTCLGGLYLEHALQILGSRTPEYLFLTHAHFDHVGAASVIKKCFPNIRIAASPTAAKILKKPRAIELITRLNEAAKSTVAAEASKRGVSRDLIDVPFEPFDIDILLEEGKPIDLGDGVGVVPLETPGHTRDFFAYYLPQRKILIPSEAVGCTDPSGFVYTEFLVSYDDYIASLERLRTLDALVLCQGHYSVLTGEDARGFFAKSAKSACEYKELVEEFLEAENGDESRVVDLVKKTEWDPRPDPKQPLAAYLLNTQARVEHLKKRMSLESKIT